MNKLVPLAVLAGAAAVGIFQGRRLVERFPVDAEGGQGRRAAGGMTNYFTAEALTAASRRTGRYSKTLLGKIRPRDFLLLARPGTEPKKQARVARLMEAGTKFHSVPELWINEKGRVQKHEGRHRSRALVRAGVSWMPVLFTSNRVVWRAQDAADCKRDAYCRTELPSSLYSEETGRPVKPAPWRTNANEASMERQVGRFKWESGPFPGREYGSTPRGGLWPHNRLPGHNAYGWKENV